MFIICSINRRLGFSAPDGRRFSSVQAGSGLATFRAEVVPTSDPRFCSKTPSARQPIETFHSQQIGLKTSISSANCVELQANGLEGNLIAKPWIEMDFAASANCEKAKQKGTGIYGETH